MTSAVVLAPERLAVVDPATGAVFDHVADCGAEAAAEAVEAAAQAQPAWAADSARRAQTLLGVAAVLRRRRNDLVSLIVSEQGKPMREAQAEVAKSIDAAEWCAHETMRIAEQGVPGGTPARRMRVVPHPVGVVAAITASNQPLALPMRKIAPAFAAGCAVVLKPSEETPLSALALAAAFAEAGLDERLLRVLPSSRPAELADVFYEDPRVRAVSYTGSSRTGRTIASRAAARMKRIVLELGGVVPFVVHADADVSSAVAGLIESKFRTSGQNCIAPNVAYVHAAVYEQFRAELIERAAALTLAAGRSDPDLGPLVSGKLRAHALTMLDDALAGGARAALHGRFRGPGFFLEPSILEHVGLRARMLREEIFGPLVALAPFSSDAELDELLDRTHDGLAIYLFTNDQRRIERAIARLHFGVIGVNDARPTDVRAPFGGLRDSGVGKESGFDAVEEFLDYKCISQRF